VGARSWLIELQFPSLCFIVIFGNAQLFNCPSSP
jgi:hypothetical protein